ncbi:hypothetical protein [Pantoea stewartii]|uniref:Uncharacterized protein n=1 Tax=Pantoea stewartii subsp. stewartii DC283 TaxID=660596 RepID=A0ABN4Z6H5_PANSE|nr:hypothetical protein [Pantoea stewartii]ARF51362.1 hypothetical protein DSJ_19935 [Pantoea stewartii subsp. stewartii DC283]KAB0549296.1 hypothetical protein F7Q90_19920 [Pantoea stewartii subsp. stewartii]
MSDAENAGTYVNDAPGQGWLARVVVKLMRGADGRVSYQVLGDTVIDDVNDEINVFGARLTEECLLACLNKFGNNGARYYDCN